MNISQIVSYSLLSEILLSLGFHNTDSLGRLPLCSSLRFFFSLFLTLPCTCWHFGGLRQDSLVLLILRRHWLISLTQIITNNLPLNFSSSDLPASGTWVTPGSWTAPSGHVPRILQARLWNSSSSSTLSCLGEHPTYLQICPILNVGNNPNVFLNLAFPSLSGSQIHSFCLLSLFLEFVYISSLPCHHSVPPRHHHR